MLNDEKIIRLIFGFKVRYLRQQQNLSYQELAKATGLSTSYLNDIEKGKRYPKPDKISHLANAFGVDYNYMVATNASKKLQPIIDLLNSKFFRLLIRSTPLFPPFLKSHAIIKSTKNSSIWRRFAPIRTCIIITSQN